ncbi:MAG: hypothetical protein FVQ81_14970 [Candidatus Glassbacteria bacterium]|nr:hypothetical protein [Candidatus Glassbacteria bacterium]
MSSRHLIMAVMLAVTLSAGCNLKVNQLNKRLDRWRSMQSKQADPEKLYEFARESLLFFLKNPALQRTKEAVISQQERINYHRKLTQMQMYLMSYHARKATEAVEGPSPDWELGRLEWGKADAVANGKVPDHPTTYLMVHIQEGYDKLVEQLVLHPEEYDQMARDFPGVMQALREMSRFKYLEAVNLLARDQRELAIEVYIKVFTRDTENFPIADRVVRDFTGQGIRELIFRRFYKERYRQSFENDRMDIYSAAATQIAQIAQDQGEAAADSMIFEVMTNVGESFQISVEQAMNFYYVVRSVQDGNLPEYLRLYRHQVLQGQKPLRAPFAE